MNDILIEILPLPSYHVLKNLNECRNASNHLNSMNDNLIFFKGSIYHRMKCMHALYDMHISHLMISRQDTFPPPPFTYPPLIYYFLINFQVLWHLLVTKIVMVIFKNPVPDCSSYTVYTYRCRIVPSLYGLPMAIS